MTNGSSEMQPKVEVTIRKLIDAFMSICLLTALSNGQVAPSSSGANAPQNRSPVAATYASPHDDAVKSNMALAKQGNAQAQQEFVCELYGSDKHAMRSMALDKLPYIGGWYSIQLYRELLSPAAFVRYRRARTKPENDNTATTDPVWWSLMSLPRVAPNPPPIAPPDSSFDSAKIQQYAQIWRDWIQANAATLKTLQPTGEGVDFLGRRCSMSFKVLNGGRR